MTEDGLWPSARWKTDQDDPLTIEVIVQRTADGERLKSICKSRGWPYHEVYDWIKDDEDKKRRFTNALEACGLDWAQETVELADEADPEIGVQKAKLQIDTRFKMAKGLDRQRFGDVPALQINAQSGSIIAILASLPPVRAPEEIDVTPEDVKIEALKKESVIPIELKDTDALFKENKAKQAALDEEDGIV